MRVGFIGLGNMGSAIAAHLVGREHDVRVWNRSPQKAAALVAAGATLAVSPKDAALGRDIVITMLADDAALDAVLAGDEGLMAGLGTGAVHVSMSTIAVATADRIAAQHADRGQGFLSAPVFGRPQAAAVAKLFVVAAGDPVQFARAVPLFECVSQRHFYVGATPSAANLVKLCGNFMILSTIEMLAEAMTLAAKGGVPKDKFLEVATGTLFGAPIVRTYGDILVAQQYRPAGFAAALGLKDMRLVAQAAEARKVPMPLLGVLRDHLLETLANEGEDIDWSGIALTISRNAGL